MTTIVATLAAGAVVYLLVMVGYLVGVRGRARDGAAAYRQGQRMLRVVDLALLRRLRVDIETGTDGVTTEQALLLYDVCQALRLDERQAQRVVGPAYWLVLDAPIGLGMVTEEEEEDVDGDLHDAR